MGLVDMKWPMMRLANTYKVARAGSVDHKCLFWVMGMTKRPKIGLDGTNGQEMTNDEV